MAGRTSIRPWRVQARALVAFAVRGWPFRVPEFALVGVQAGVAIHGECARPWSAAGARPSTPPHSCRAGFLSAVTRVSRAPCLLTYNTRLPRKLVVKKVTAHSHAVIPTRLCTQGAPQKTSVLKPHETAWGARVAGAQASVRVDAQQN